MHIREKRRVYGLMRSAEVGHDHFMPDLGITMGEFAFWQVVAEVPRRRSK